MFSTKTKKIAIHIDNEQINVGVANYKTNPYTIEYLTQLPLDSQELAKFVKDNKLKNLPAYLVLGGKQIVSRVITIPEIPKKEIGPALQWEVTKYIPIPPEEMIFDYEIIEKVEGPNSKQIRLMVIAARNTYVENYCELVAQAGLKPKVVDVEGMVLKYLYFNLQDKQNDGNSCCIYLDNKICVFSFIVRNNVFFIHNVEWEQESNNRLLTEYQRVNNYLQRQLQMASVQNIFLFGSDGKRDTAEFLTNEIGIPVKVADLQIEAFSLPEEIKKVNPGYSFTIGVLLREVE